MEEEVKFRVIHPRLVVQIITTSISGIIIFINSGKDSYINIVFLLLIIFYIGFLIRRKYFTKLSLTLGLNYIVTNKGEKYDSSQIEVIYIALDRVGFKLTGASIIPIDLHISFPIEIERQAMNSIREWAMRNNKQIIIKRFISWL
ncbi:hypothetical protein BHU72_00820 [Desulfuribacillus stibiiarsenatis]|uniref:DUF5673 domain-containing protein n=1 Tax=Desulfuribacillus stibiiarsenatis TaxID=1390249 RepID=A0A1E5L9P0_9FIRM|nr:hypothetical protein [Desulfuribacillus stibiiarsenatis]OEH86841.1 hypothetical protein BHU72_00820 [Desulfuribacillus stibiiarsenatis]